MLFRGCRNLAGLIITVDIGTSSCKVCVFDEEGQILFSTKRDYPAFSPQPGFAEQDPVEIYRNVKQTVKEAVESFPDSSFSAIGFDTMLHSSLLVDREGNPLYPLLNWMDTRSAHEVEEMRDEYQKYGFYKQNAAPLHTIFNPPRVRWFRKNMPELWQKAQKMVTIKDWVLWNITGVLGCDFSTASATGLMDLQKVSWSKDILDWLQLSEDFLPPLCPPENVLPLREGDFSADTGLAPGLPVVWGGGDGPFANLGEGAFREKEMVVTVGSSGAVRMCQLAPVFDPQERGWCYYLADSIWVGGGAINNGGIVYSWVRDLLNKEAKDFELDIRRERPLFLPFLTGERSPNWKANARGIVFGLSYFHDFASLMQAAFEGVAFRVRSIYDMLCEIMGKPKRVVLSGGFAQTDKGERVICDVLGREVEVSSLPSASARGAFLVSLKALGEVKRLVELPDKFFPPNPVLEPVAEHALFYNQLYELYWEIYRRNVDLFDRFIELGLA